MSHKIDYIGDGYGDIVGNIAASHLQVPSLILSTVYCLCEVSHVLTVATWVPPDSLASHPKNMLVGGLAALGVNDCVNTWTGIIFLSSVYLEWAPDPPKP